MAKAAPRRCLLIPSVATADMGLPRAERERKGRFPMVKQVSTIERAVLADGLDGAAKVEAGRRGPVDKTFRSAVAAEPPSRQEHSADPIASATAKKIPGMNRTLILNPDHLNKKHLLSPGQSRTRLAEEFRIIKFTILADSFRGKSDDGRNSNVIMVTSSKPREGKTFLATNLAISIAIERETHVLLVDADVIHPNVMPNLGFSNDMPGLTDLLSSPTSDPGSFILNTSIEKLSVIPAGTNHALTPELLNSSRMRQLVSELASRYPDRVILFDSPPLLAASEPTVLARMVGHIVFVVEANRTRQADVDAALAMIEDCEKVYLILNKTSAMFGTTRFGVYYHY